MTDPVIARLAALGIALPAPPAAVASYVPFKWAGDTLYISGQLPMQAGTLRYSGRLGEALSLEDGIAAARLCAINLLAQAAAATEGRLSQLSVVKLVGFVASAPDFTDQPKVVNGASDLMQQAFGDPGRHARSAVAAPVLPLGAAVEVEAIMMRLR